MACNRRFLPWQILLLTGACVVQLLCLALSLSAAQAAEPAMHPVRSAVFWESDWKQGWKTRPLQQRVMPAPDEVLEYLQQDCELAMPPKSVHDEDLAALVGTVLEDIVAALPGHLAALLEQGVPAVMLAEGIGSSGYVESIEAPGSPAGKQAFVVLDAGMMRGRKANAWAGMRESSFFCPGPVRIAMTIASPEENDIAHGLRYILLHELGHCVGLLSGAHPDWMAQPEREMVKRYPFLGFSWQVNDARFTPKRKIAFPWRDKLRIYAFAQAQLTSLQAPEIYEDICQNSNWPTLYAATTPFEDFAESFAVWQHAVHEGRPWAVTVTPLDGSRQRWISCLETGSCRRKASFMAELFREKDTGW